jgi:hypothetical protein
MTLENRIAGLIQLGAYLRTKDDALDEVIENSSRANKWFTAANQRTALDAIATQMLEQAKLSTFANAYSMPTEQKRIGLIPAGNIPLVGFHDWLCIFLAGHQAIIKSSEKDPYWLPFLTNKLVELQPESASSFEFVDTLKGYDAVIATGSNNSSRYFETYFKHVPNIIRQNRNSVAILDGTESTADLRLLADDIFTYFGLGCRNVSKLYVPTEYNFEALLEVFHEHKELILHNKYQNNFDYNIVLYLLNKIPYQNNGCIILTEGKAFSTRIASLNYEYYEDRSQVELALEAHQTELQCIVSKQPLTNLTTVSFGQSQRPELQDFADGINTMAFLTTL